MNFLSIFQAPRELVENVNSRNSNFPTSFDSKSEFACARKLPVRFSESRNDKLIFREYRHLAKQTNEILHEYRTKSPQGFTLCIKYTSRSRRPCRGHLVLVPNQCVGRCASDIVCKFKPIHWVDILRSQVITGQSSWTPNICNTQ